MRCKYFGKCGSCTVFELPYEKQLQKKYQYIKDLFSKFYEDDIDLFASDSFGFRNRAEFRIWHSKNGINYAMNGFDKKDIVQIDSCQIVQKNIQDIMPRLINAIKDSAILREKLFGVEFLSFDGSVLIVMLYHKKIDDVWKKAAKELSDRLLVNIIGRSRGVRIVVKDDFVYMKLDINGESYLYKIYENSFVQPNTKINRNMIDWVLSKSKSFKGDMLELHCGIGNFTVPLSKNFSKVLATEISKSSIRSAKENCKLNKIDNITFVRLSERELIQALKKERVFRRLKEVELDSYKFSTVFVDPPRAGIDEDNLKLLSTFKNIIYISCNPTTLKRDIELLSKTHKIVKFAIFDQFPYTNHVECGVILKKS